MISPSPTQQPTQSTPDQKIVRSTPTGKRRGETPLALFIKAILRPIIKLIYSILRLVRGHKLLTVGLILLLLVSISITTYVTTGVFPLGIGKDQFNFHINGGGGGGETVKNWLYALRDGDVTKLSLIQAQLTMSQPPDPNQLISTYSQPKAHLTWKSINVMGTYTESDSTVDSFVSVDFTGPGPGGATNGVMVWHFITLPQAQGRLLSVDIVNVRTIIGQSGG